MAVENTIFEVTFDVPGFDVQKITAAYTSGSDQFPGWVLFHGPDQTIVAKVRSDRALIIRRADSTPASVSAAAPSPQVTVHVSGNLPGSPAFANVAGAMQTAVNRSLA